MALALFGVIGEVDVWQILAIIVKAMTYGASFMAGGGVLFLALFTTRIKPTEEQAVRSGIVCAALAGMVLSVLRIIVMNGMLSGAWGGMFDATMTRIVLASSEGLATGLRLAGLLLIAVLMSVMKRQALQGLVLWVALLAAAVAMTSFALVGHAGELAEKHGWLPQLLLCLHLLAIGFWLGALWPLHRITHGDELGRIAQVMQRFGRIAVFVVSLLVIVGVVLLWWLLGSLAALWTTPYGQMVMLKLVAVALLLGLAALNKLRLTPQLLDGDRTVLKKLRRSIRFEVAVAFLILLITASFTTLTGPSPEV